MNLAQVEAIWIANGGSPKLAPLMAGIAIAESGGDTMALNANPQTQDFSVGLWQINYFGDLAKPRTARYGTPDQLSQDVNRQARAAINLAGKNGEGIASGWGGGGNLNNADPLYRAWLESPIYPNYPTMRQVSQLLHSMGRGTGFAQGVQYRNGVFSGPNSNVQIIGASPAAQEARLGQAGQTAIGAQGVQGVAGGAATELAGAANVKVGCNAGQPVFKTGGVFGVGAFQITKCEIKALTSGIIIAAGVTIMVVGVVIVGVSAGGPQVQRAARNVAKRTPVGKATQGASKAVSAAVKLPKPPAPPKKKKPRPLTDEETARVIAAGERGAFKKPAA